MQNPFKFGTVVDEPYFTNRVKEIAEVKSIMESSNHLIIISPRRYGKTSLITKVIKSDNRPHLVLDLQLITSVDDFAAGLLKRLYKVFPGQKIRDMVKNFRVLPTISLNPLTNEIDVSYRASAASSEKALEDVLDLIEKLSEKKKSIIVLDEFQEVGRIGKDLDRLLRAVMQHHKNINYVFLGSQESLVREIFEKKKSPFYHFGHLLPLGKIPRKEFSSYLKKNLSIAGDKRTGIIDEILKITDCHPYYTQQLAFNVWELLNKGVKKEPVKAAAEEIIRHHDIDYERLWNTLKNTEKKILIGMVFSDSPPMSNEFNRQFNTGPTSTTYNGIKKLMQNGYILKSAGDYELDDPFFRKWIRMRRTR